MKKKIIIGVVVLVVIIAGIFIFRTGNGISTDNLITIGRADLIKEVEVSGKVQSKQESDLSFETIGTISRILVEVGDQVETGQLLASLDSSELSRQLDQDLANLDIEKIALDNLFSDNSSTNDLSEERKDAINAVREAYTSAENSIHQYIDQFYSDADSDNPQILTTLDNSYEVPLSLDKNRKNVGEILEEWGQRVNIFNLSNFTDQDIEQSLTYLQTISSFLAQMGQTINSFEPKGQFTQATLDNYRSDVASARSAIQSAISSVTSSRFSIQDVSSEIPLQQAKVQKAQSIVNTTKAKIAKTELRAPFSGLISNVDIELGELSQTNISAISIVDAENLEIEAFIPEVNVAQIRSQNRASFTLDAYGEEKVFEAIVKFTDPTETIRDGVSTYRTILDITNNQNLVRPGMTAEIGIVTEVIENVINVPVRSIIEEDGKSFVTVRIRGPKTEQREIQTGRKDTAGNIEVISGLSEGEVVLLNPIDA